MKLDPKLAQSIVDKMMEIIPYNINMMNESGYIIASGDKKRINTLHIGAIETIESGKTKRMTKSFGKFGQPGVNIPITFQDKTIGVIGITGEPDRVTPLASLLKISTELLISQINNTKIEGQHKETLNHFLYQWTDTDDPLNNEEIKLRAKSLNIDLFIDRIVIIIETDDFNKIQVNDNNFHFNKSSNEILIITKHDYDAEGYLKYCQQNNLAIGISNKGTDLKKFVRQAQNTIDVSKELRLDHVYYYRQIKFLDTILESNLYSIKYLSTFKGLLKSNSGQELLETLDCYFKHNGNVTDTSSALNIHRNTTNYRLNKISELFDLNLHNLTDTMQLYINYLHFRKYQYQRK